MWYKNDIRFSGFEYFSHFFYVQGIKHLHQWKAHFVIFSLNYLYVNKCQIGNDKSKWFNFAVKFR